MARQNLLRARIGAPQIGAPQDNDWRVSRRTARC
jgi:hypothetical protein